MLSAPFPTMNLQIVLLPPPQGILGKILKKIVLSFKVYSNEGCILLNVDKMDR